MGHDSVVSPSCFLQECALLRACAYCTVKVCVCVGGGCWIKTWCVKHKTRAEKEFKIDHLDDDYIHGHDCSPLPFRHCGTNSSLSAVTGLMPFYILYIVFHHKSEQEWRLQKKHVFKKRNVQSRFERKCVLFVAVFASDDIMSAPWGHRLGSLEL